MSSDQSQNSLISERDVDCMCGMLMQLNSEINNKMADLSDNGDKHSSLRISNQDNIEASQSSRFISVITSDKNDNDKESEIKRLLRRTEGTRLHEFTEDLLDVNAKDSRGRTPLIYAVSESSASIIRAFLKSDKIDLLIRDRSGNTALMYASVRGYDSVVKLFMDEFKRRYKKDSATLLDYLDAENDNGDTAFTLALKNGHEDCVIVLSEYLKEALEKEERRVTSLAYRMGLRGRSESRMSAVSSKDEPNKEAFELEDNMRENDRLRCRSLSPEPKIDTKSITLPSFDALIRKRGRDASRYFATDDCALLDSDESASESPINRSATVGIHINVDVRVDHYHRYHYGKMASRLVRKVEKSKVHRRRVQCEKHRDEKQGLYNEEIISD